MESTQIKQLKDDLLKVMSRMGQFAGKYPKLNIPEVTPEFRLSEDILKNGEFNVAVCGKVKNGKSSLINALIGRDLLPTCNDVATSRVFKISNADTDSFFLVFANGDKKEITAEELKNYGSQAVIDEAGELSAAQSIAYIQVNTRLDFLPEGVSLLDTPGIGSTYPQHTAVTKQSMQRADAAIFVLNPTPMEASEIDFLKEVASATPGILFVTTKTDLHNPQTVADAIARNKEQITQAVGKDLVFGVMMESMSSEILKSAVMCTDTDDASFQYELSGYAKVKETLSRMVFMTLGIYRSAQAYNNSVTYYQTVLKALNNRKQLVDEAQANYTELLAKYDAANREFTARMGEKQRKEAIAQIEQILRTMESDFNEIFSTKGAIYTKFANEIDALSESEIAVYSETLGENILSQTQQAWDSLTQLVQRKCEEVLLSFNEECKVALPSDIKIAVNPDDVADPSISDVEFRDKMGKMRTEMFMGTAITGGLGTLMYGASYFFPALVTPAAPIIAPVMVVLGVGAVLWGVISGNKKAKVEKLQKNKNQLTKFLQETLQSCRKQLVETSLVDNKYESLYQGFLLAVRQQANDSIKSIYDRYKSELDAMKETVMKSKQDPEMKAAIEFLITEWGKAKPELSRIQKSLETLKESI
ncbi:MAG: dynamin family protein [Muribaculaceae bacterium]